ncbi:MAG: heme peroxidase family protein [Chloroflexota bacterium]
MKHSHHGAKAFRRGMNTPRSKYYNRGRFGRLFPNLAPFLPREENLAELGRKEGVMDPGLHKQRNNPNIAAGFVFFGQFVDHDITFDPTSSLERQNDPEATKNFRTPALELDSVYGAGPEASPYLYERDGMTLLIDVTAPRDLPRNSKNVALIGDPRNDENLIVSQLHLAFLKFHNSIVKQVGDFEEAQRLVRWHYQWIVLHEFLPALVGQELVDEIYDDRYAGGGRRYYQWRNEPFIPVEFSVAAYRFGHAQVPATLQVNDVFKVNGSSHIPLFDRDEFMDEDPDDLSGFGRRAERRFVDWNYLFDTGDGAFQASKRIDTTLSGPLFDLPFVAPGGLSSLAQRNLLRGRSFGLPTGQAVAQAMCLSPLSCDALEDVAHLGFHFQTPLWFYVLREAAVLGKGKKLGPVGGRIVAEVLIGLLEGDRFSFVRANPQWKPTLGAKEGEFGIVDLLDFAGA